MRVSSSLCSLPLGFHDSIADLLVLKESREEPSNISSLWHFLLAGLATAFTTAYSVSGFNSCIAAGSWLTPDMAAGYGLVNGGSSSVL